MRAVLELVAQKAGWDPAKPLPKGRGRGIAVAEAFKSYVAQVAEVSVDADGKVKVERVVCAVDCGIAINPDIVAAQMEGGIGFGLGAVLHSAITLKDGQVEQRNFDGYHVLRMAEMPKVEVHIVPSAEAPLYSFARQSRNVCCLMGFISTASTRAALTSSVGASAEEVITSFAAASASSERIRWAS